MVCQLRKRMEQLEQTITDLGSEIFVQRTQIALVKDQRDQLLALVDGVKTLLSSNDLLSVEDFENAVSLAEAEKVATDYSEDIDIGIALNKLKTVAH
ncbi:MAG: hypothetical protein OXT67_11365 [Zetaproteobacteria bacterium]|nr:hypothetical protein [Zetaproteobacteria bacterium]